jgi:hypothetical protein
MPAESPVDGQRIRVQGTEGYVEILHEEVAVGLASV